LSGSSLCANCPTNCNVCISDKICLSCNNNMNVIYGTNDNDLICSSNTKCSSNYQFLDSVYKMCTKGNTFQ